MKTRTRFSIHTGSINATYVAYLLKRNGAFDVLIETEHVHATLETHSPLTIGDALKKALGYLPSRMRVYYESEKPQEVEINNDGDDDGC